MKQCPQCHHMNADKAQFCVGCGSELTRQCNACGKEVSAEARYCSQCGAVIITEPPVPWIERRFSPEVRLALHAVTRGIGVTMLVLAFVTAFLTPPPRIFDEAILLVVGATLMVLSELLKSGRKPKPPGGKRPALPEEPPPGGIELIPPEELLETEQALARSGQPPGSTQGPFLN
jgi:hypothetical protein